MSHVLDHVHTRIHSIQYLLQFSPYFSYKLYLNSVYKYSITIPLYMLPILLYPKDGKNTCISALLYGVFYHINTLSILICDKVMY